MAVQLGYIVVKEVGKKIVKKAVKKRSKSKSQKKTNVKPDESKNMKRAKKAAVVVTPTAIGAHVVGKKKRKELDKKLYTRRK